MNRFALGSPALDHVVIILARALFEPTEARGVPRPLISSAVDEGRVSHISPVEAFERVLEAIKATIEIVETADSCVRQRADLIRCFWLALRPEEYVRHSVHDPGAILDLVRGTVDPLIHG